MNRKIDSLMKKLNKNIKKIDPIVTIHFYQYQLKQLNLSDKKIINLLGKCNNDYIAFMAIIRAEQLALLDKTWINKVIKTKKPLPNYQLEEIKFQVQKELYLSSFIKS